MSRVRSKNKRSIRGSKLSLGVPALANKRPSKIRTHIQSERRREPMQLARVSALPRSQRMSHDRVRESRWRKPAAPHLQTAGVIGARAARLAKRENLHRAFIGSVDDVCGKRKRRREVIHATGRAGRSATRKLPRFTWRSLIKCK